MEDENQPQGPSAYIRPQGESGDLVIGSSGEVKDKTNRKVLRPNISPQDDFWG